MELATTILNTMLLVALFWYQKNKNKVLQDRISEQSNLLQETKDVVTNQAQAIESQKKVVDTALEYSEKFDFNKIENIIKREVDLEYKEIIKEQQTKISNQEQSLEKSTETAKKAIKLSAEHVTTTFLSPLISELYGFLLMATPDKREAVLSKIPEIIAKTMKPSLEEFDRTRPPSLLGVRPSTKKSSNSGTDGAVS